VNANDAEAPAAASIAYERPNARLTPPERERRAAPVEIVAARTTHALAGRGCRWLLRAGAPRQVPIAVVMSWGPASQ
jgi:hypothetical protein